MTQVDCVWNSPPPNLVLPHDEIHVWCASLDQAPSLVAELVQTFSADERLRAERYHFSRDRQSFIISRGLLRMILGGYLDSEPGRLQFCSGPYGKLALAETSNSYILQFNMSHSHELALFAFARDREVGVDVEYIRPIPEAEQIAERYFSEEERESLHSLPPDRMHEQFFIYWTRLEAYLKASGDGLGGSDEPGGAPPTTDWSIDSMMPAPGYIGALAVQGKVASMRTVYLQWTPFEERREVVYEPGKRG
jgi:4'-phosphopantetheinyl transferase